MVSVKRCILDISLDLLKKTVIIREKSLPNGQMLFSDRTNVVDIDPISLHYRLRR